MLSDIDTRLTEYLEKASSGDSTYWSFQGNSHRRYTHNYFQYPAMMVPQMQGELLKAVLHSEPLTYGVFDPFVGSGTVLTETMIQGLNFTGRDINPLAILLCRTKSEALDFSEIENSFELVKRYISDDQSTVVDINFPNIHKWFRKDIAQQLAKIRRAILQIDNLQCRRFFWIGIAETVRLTSNSRTSNFKLYIQLPEVIQTKQLSPINIFYSVVVSNLAQLKEHIQALKEKKLVENHRYKGRVNIELGDTRERIEEDLVADLLITSPPYGDNKTTVTYGQYSYLPLQWINLSDIDTAADQTYLASTQEIDSRSLGGSLAAAEKSQERLKQMSQSFASTLEDLKHEPEDRSKRVTAFCRDLDETLDPILARLTSTAIMIWTIGNRHVGGKQVPTDEILEQLLAARGAYLIKKLQREFPSHSKRMENISNTMNFEKVLVMRKGKLND